MSDDGNEFRHFGDAIDITIFEQILEMDDDEEEREFSRSIVYGFFEQAETTFTQMDDALEAGDLDTLSSLGHFLKGSSATIGLTLVKNSCEKIQNYGHKKDESGQEDVDDDALCLSRCKDAIVAAKEEYEDAAKRLRRFFGDESGADE